MNKSQMIQAAIGGTVVVGVLVLGYFIWDAFSVKGECEETLDDGVNSAARYMKALPMKPEQTELKVYEDAVSVYGDWRAEARRLASRGDLVFDKTTPAAFKAVLVGEARKISELPGCFDGHFAKPDFHFGFRNYVTGGALPPDNEADLKRLQREWNDVSTVLKTIAECGGVDAGVVDVRMGEQKAKPEVEEEVKPKKKGRKTKVKKTAPAEDRGAVDATSAGPAVTSFTVEFVTKPSGLVKAINAFATGTRFVVVENCSFVREKDEIAEALGGDAKKSESTSSGRRRRRAQAQAESSNAAEKGGLVTDPATASPLKVTMAISVYDFGSLEEEPKEKDEGEEKRGAK